MNVMVATDGSPRSLAVLPHAARFAAATDTPVTLVRLLDPRADASDEVDVSLASAIEKVVARWKAELDALLRDNRIQGEAFVVTKQRAEPDGQALLRAAEELGAGMIALESRGTGSIRHAVFGSVAMAVIGRSSLPVMVTTKPEPPPERDGGYHIVATNDGSPASRDVLVALGPLLAGRDVHVSLLRILEPRLADTDEAAELAAAQVELEALRPTLPHVARLDLVVRRADAGRKVDAAILETATVELQADAIAMSTHGHSALRHVFAGSVALAVLKDSPLPVILARGEA